MAFTLLLGWSVKGLHVIVGIIWIVILIAAHELWDAGTAATPAFHADGLDTTSISERNRVAPDEEFAAPRQDRYGNQLLDAVGDYRVDSGGELYERHAPDTAVLRLGPPGT